MTKTEHLNLQDLIQMHKDWESRNKNFSRVLSEEPALKKDDPTAEDIKDYYDVLVEAFSFPTAGRYNHRCDRDKLLILKPSIKIETLQGVE